MQEKMPVKTVVVGVVVTEVVAVVVVVALVVPVVVVVGLVVGDVVPVVVVTVVVCVVVVVALEVCVVVVVGLVVPLVVGVVTSQPSNPPRMKASVIRFIVSATAAQVSSNAFKPAPTHWIAAASPSGPLYSVKAAASASPVSPQVSAFCSLSSELTSTFSKSNESAHEMVPLTSAGQVLSTRIKTLA